MNWFKRPYPLLETIQTKLFVVFGFGIFIATFLYIYQPFGISKIENYKELYVAGIGTHIALVLAINYFLTPKIFKGFFVPEKWTIGKEIIYILSSFFLCTCSNYIYNTTIGDQISPYKGFFEFLGITFAVGIFPVMIMVFLMERNLSSKNTVKANEFSKALAEKKNIFSEEKSVQIQSETTKPTKLDLTVRNFIFATSDNNYSTIFYEIEGQLEKKLLRLSFKNLEEQISNVQQIVRCHKSYIVNRDRILEVKGNARSLMLRVDLYEQMIPVSRSFPKENLL